METQKTCFGKYCPKKERIASTRVSLKYNITKTIAIIPARGNSKRLPKKNIKLLGGIPLIVHSINYAKQHDFIDAIYVSTNDDDIKKIAQDNSINIIDRPTELSGDFEPTVTAMKHVLESLNCSTIETVILLQPTNPLRPTLLLKEAYHLFDQKKYDSLFTVSQNHYKLGRISNSEFIPFNYKIGQRSQDLDPLFYENGLLYITKSKHIFNNEIITKNGYPLVIKHPFATIDIDFQEDLDFAEYMLKKYKNE